VVTVYVEDGDYERALKKFKKLVEKREILEEYKKREYYIPPSQKRKLKSLEARRRAYREQRKLATDYEL
jgi:small subunit ribosomal protein S21